MIRRNEIQRPLAQPLPQFFAILALAYRRRAFEFRRAVRNFLRNKS